MKPVFSIEMKVKEMFFDRPKVVAAVERAKRRVFARGGGLVRTTASRSIRKRKGTSQPGKPPSSHEGSLRKGIRFAYDRASDSVVVGPLAFRKSDAPHTLEFGGSVFVRNRLIADGDGVGRGAGGKFVTRKRFRRFTGKLRIKARPFMAPALEKSRDKLPKHWQNSIRGG